MPPSDRPVEVLPYADPPRRRSRAALIIAASIGGIFVLSMAAWFFSDNYAVPATPVRTSYSATTWVSARPYSVRCDPPYRALVGVETDLQTGASKDALSEHLAAARIEMENFERSLDDSEKQNPSLAALKSALSKFEKTAANPESVEERAHQATPATQERASTDLVKDAAADLREARKLIDESR